jgi:hypothetical protein
MGRESPDKRAARLKAMRDRLSSKFGDGESNIARGVHHTFRPVTMYPPSIVSYGAESVLTLHTSQRSSRSGRTAANEWTAARVCGGTASRRRQSTGSRSARRRSTDRSPCHRSFLHSIGLVAHLRCSLTQLLTAAFRRRYPR